MSTYSYISKGMECRLKRMQPNRLTDHGFLILRMEMNVKRKGKFYILLYILLYYLTCYSETVFIYYLHKKKQHMLKKRNSGAPMYCLM